MVVITDSWIEVQNDLKSVKDLNVRPEGTILKIQSLPNFISSIFRIRRQKIVYVMTPLSKGR